MRTIILLNECCFNEYYLQTKLVYKIKTYILTFVMNMEAPQVGHLIINDVSQLAE